MEYIFEIFILVFINYLSYLTGSRAFKKENLKIHVDEFFIPFKKYHNEIKFLIDSPFASLNLVDAIFDLVIELENKTQFFTNSELKILNELSLIDRFDSANQEEIISKYFELSYLVRKRYNKIATLYFYPKWKD
jgi:hypothetical protein